MLARKAPRKIPGQARYPRRSNAASAIPAGGQIAVALAFANASVSPSLAVPKYTAATRTTEPVSLIARERVIPIAPLQGEPWPPGGASFRIALTLRTRA